MYVHFQSSVTKPHRRTLPTIPTDPQIFTKVHVCTFYFEADVFGIVYLGTMGRCSSSIIVCFIYNSMCSLVNVD